MLCAGREKRAAPRAEPVFTSAEVGKASKFRSRGRFYAFFHISIKCTNSKFCINSDNWRAMRAPTDTAVQQHSSFFPQRCRGAHCAPAFYAEFFLFNDYISKNPPAETGGQRHDYFTWQLSPPPQPEQPPGQPEQPPFFRSRMKLRPRKNRMTARTIKTIIVAMECSPFLKTGRGYLALYLTSRSPLSRYGRTSR